MSDGQGVGQLVGAWNRRFGPLQVVGVVGRRKISQNEIGQQVGGMHAGHTRGHVEEINWSRPRVGSREKKKKGRGCWACALWADLGQKIKGLMGFARFKWALGFGPKKNKNKRK